MKKPYTLFIADLHITDHAPEVTRAFFTLLRTESQRADALYILGDFFDRWLGDDDDTDTHREIINALNKLSAQVPVYFMRGNHDFMIGRRFAKATGIQLLRDPTLIQLYGQAILLTHGDLLCTRDKKHQLYRKLYNNTLLRWTVGQLSLNTRHNIAQRLHQSSVNHKMNYDTSTLDVNPITTNALLQHYQADQIIHGHTHRPGTYLHTVGQKQIKRIVLDCWHHQANYLRYEQNGHFALINMDHTS